MSEKTSCPGCNAYTSSVFQAFEEGQPCPYCGLSADAARAVDEARDRKATADLAERLLTAEKRAEKAERANGALRRALADVRDALGGCLCGADRIDWDSPVVRDRPHEPDCPRHKEVP